MSLGEAPRRSASGGCGGALTRRRAAALALLLASPAGCGGAISEAPAEGSAGERRSGAAAAAGEICLRGRATAEGVECQAFRTADGRLYTLMGDLGGLAAEREVCVCGRPVEMSTCMQGTTITVSRIGPPERCP